MSQKYEMYLEERPPTINGGKTQLYRVRAMRDIAWGLIKAGTEGGWIESEKNLPQTGESWAFPGSMLTGSNTPPEPIEERVKALLARLKGQKEAKEVSEAKEAPSSAPTKTFDGVQKGKNTVRIGNTEITLTEEQIRQLDDINNKFYKENDILITFNDIKENFTVSKADKEGKVKKNQRRVSPEEFRILSNIFKPKLKSDEASGQED